MEQQTLSFLHAGSVGDVWASLPTIREGCRKRKMKAILYLQKDVEAFYYEGAVHPTKTNGTNVMLNQKMIDMMIPLLKAQPFIHDAKVYDGEYVTVNLNAFRETFVNMPNHPLQKWYFYVFPDGTCNLSEEWLTVPDAEKDFAKGKIIVARTERYQNENRTYSFLKKYEEDILFSGTMREYNNFCMTYDLSIRKLHIENFLELAQAVKQCKFLLSNQTQIFQLAEGVGQPRMVELCYYAPNVTTFTKGGYEFYGQKALEDIFHELNGETKDFYEIKNPAIGQDLQ